MRLISRLAGLCVMALALGACAKGADEIAAAATPAGPYMAMSCGDLTLERARIAERLTALSVRQEETRRADTMGVWIIGLPVGSLDGGDRSKDIAREKGAAAAVAQALEAKACQR